MIDKDEFDTWKSHPTTQWVLEAFEQALEDQREQFLLRVFYGNEMDPYEIGLMRGAFIGLTRLTGDELTYETMARLHESGELQLDLNGVWVTPNTGGRQ